MTSAVSELQTKGQAARQAARRLPGLSTEVKNRALHSIAEALLSRQEEILAANAEDHETAGASGLAASVLDRLLLNPERLAGVAGVHPLDVTRVPGCTYTRPQVASVGLTERAAVERGHALKVGRFPFIGNGKAIALGEPEGLVKTVFDAKTGELLGAHMIGAEVTELIQGYVVGRQLETTEEDLMQAVFPHPTLSEMMHESVLDASQAVGFRFSPQLARRVGSPPPPL